MGLDQYLTAKLYTSKYSDNEIREKLKVVIPDIYDSGNLDYIKVVFEVGYWRKANQIHRWFVENVQDGEDDCKDYYVSREQLIDLMNKCKMVLESKENAEEILPTQEGFFFGGTEYDDYYFETCEDTIKIIEKCLKLPEAWDFVYRGSW